MAYRPPEPPATLQAGRTYSLVMILPLLPLALGALLWGLSLWPEPEILHGLTWPGLFFADQRFPIGQILHSVFEIGAIVFLTAGLVLLFQQRGWSIAQISVTGVGLTLLSLGALWLWESGGSAFFLVFMIGLCLAISPWLGTGTTRPRPRRTPTS